MWPSDYALMALFDKQHEWLEFTPDMVVGAVLYIIGVVWLCVVASREEKRR